MKINDSDKLIIEELVKKILEEKLSETEVKEDFDKKRDISGVTSVSIPTVKVGESDKLDTGKNGDVVYTRDLFSTKESPRLGCGVMEMKDTTFDWTLDYDEIDYIIEGKLDILVDDREISASAGELILIPKGSKIKFSVKGHARFIYVTYPADWASQ